MDYIECQVPTANAMFDKIMASDTMRVPFSASGPGGAAYRPMPTSFPVFPVNHAKAVASLDRASVPQQQGAGLAGRSLEEHFKEIGRPYMHPMAVSPLNMTGIIQHQTPGESASSLLGDGTMEKTKRNGRGEGGGRGSRGGATTGRKRTRGGQMTDSLTTGSVLEGSLSGGGGAQSTGRATAANGGARQQNNSIGEKAEKSTGRRQSGQGSKRGEKKQPQPVPPSVSETPCAPYNGVPHATRVAEANGFPADWTGGVLDIYGLRTRKANIGQYMVEIPLNELLSAGYEAPKLVLKEYRELEKVEDEETLDQKISGILQLFPVRPSKAEVHGETAENAGSRLTKNSKILVDLESPVPPEDEMLSKQQERVEKVLGANFLSGSKFETGSEKDMRAGSQSINGTTQGVGSFKVDGLPLHPFEDFMTRLKLGPSESLQSLIAQSQGDNDANVTSDTRMDSAVVDMCHRNRSIPPLPCSYPPVGPVKAEHYRWNHRVWSLQPAIPSNAATCEAGASVEDAQVGAEEDASPRSSYSRRRKLDGKVKAQTPEAMAMCIPPSSPPPPTAPLPTPLSNPPTEECTVSVKEEPRQVENAAVLSSEGTPNPMEVDSCRVDNGAVAVTVIDRPETLPGKQAENMECDQERSGGEAVRPLETPATLLGPQEMDVCDRQSKPLADVKQEAGGDQEGKELVESNGEPKPDETVLKEEQLPALPSVDIKIMCPSPPQNESASTSPVPLSPGVSIAAHILMSIHKDTFQQLEPEKTDGERERRRRVFQPYQGAPTQKATKSMRVSSTTVNHRQPGGDAGKEGKTNADAGSVPPSKALVSERRKSLSQIDTPEKPSISSPRNSSGGGVSTSSRGGSHTAARTSNLSVKMEKCAAKESAKDSSSNKDAGGRSLSSLPPLGLPSSKSAHKGAKTNGYTHSSNPKGSSATANFAKVPTACSTQRVASGGGSRSSRPAHNNNTPGSHGTAPVPVKSSRQSIPDGRQKSKADGSSRGSKSSRD
ncbi:hypothetical protein MPTK1_5g11030 [Marchantia polymorpha subsp. ruderalis]|uniref:Uncharacterized protein n=2 Tax=Marchantia polymorpha TaxID=3197 RepID=A0AAF6BH50_MARPO|nr:hypothetical protein MARPO_0093s0025 [Marchantia polymorpha]BBN11334.1 hypothetical protein Mp_5g11030 [Marchantia polymorpha subsp. ruderalis]|eukprot:PTQ32942.1 hypothetical protein MARPO_0093s0025 [Marchantia polymorpha]